MIRHSEVSVDGGKSRRWMDGEMMVVIKQYFMAKRDYKMDYIGLTGLHGGYY